jgi:hypothetical protein
MPFDKDNPAINSDFAKLRQSREVRMLELVQLPTSKLAASETGRHAGLGQSPFATTVGRKTFLFKRAGEPRFAPRQYYYAASKSGVVPSLPMSGPVSNLDEGGEVQLDAA